MGQGEEVQRCLGLPEGSIGVSILYTSPELIEHTLNSGGTCTFPEGLASNFRRLMDTLLHFPNSGMDPG